MTEGVIDLTERLELSTLRSLLSVKVSRADQLCQAGIRFEDDADFVATFRPYFLGIKYIFLTIISS